MHAKRSGLGGATAQGLDVAADDRVQMPGDLFRRPVPPGQSHQASDSRAGMSSGAKRVLIGKPESLWLAPFMMNLTPRAIAQNLPTISLSPMNGKWYRTLRSKFSESSGSS